MSKFENLSKTVQISDPENWYGRNTATVTLSVIDPYDEDATLVQILVEAIIGDISCTMGYWFLSPDRNEKNVEWAYNKFKSFNYGKMPDIISLNWLYEHGYKVPYEEWMYAHSYMKDND